LCISFYLLLKMCLAWRWRNNKVETSRTIKQT